MPYELTVKISKPTGLFNQHSVNGKTDGRKLSIAFYLDCGKMSVTLPLKTNVILPIKNNITISIPESSIGSLKNIFMWIEPFGYGSLINATSSQSFAVGVLKYPMPKILGKQKNLSIELHVVQSAISYIVEEMRVNQNHNDVKRCAKLNREANYIYNDVLAEKVESSGYRQVDLAFSSFKLRHTVENLFSNGGHRPIDRGTLISNITGNKNADLYRRNLIPGSNSHLQKTIILTIERYMDLKEEALSIWTGRVHTNSSSIVSLGMDAVFPGKPTWDHKPYLGKRWAHHNRLGNKGYWINYDVWSNLHFAYVGKIAGFSWEELNHGATSMQKADTGTPDAQRDVQSMKEGFGLIVPSIAELVSIINRYKHRWGGVSVSM